MSRGNARIDFSRNDSGVFVGKECGGVKWSRECRAGDVLLI